MPALLPCHTKAIVIRNKKKVRKILVQYQHVIITDTSASPESPSPLPRSRQLRRKQFTRCLQISRKRSYYHPFRLARAMANLFLSQCTCSRTIYTYDVTLSYNSFYNNRNRITRWTCLSLWGVETSAFWTSFGLILVNNLLLPYNNARRK